MLLEIRDCSGDEREAAGCSVCGRRGGKGGAGGRTCSRVRKMAAGEGQKGLIYSSQYIEM